MEVGVGRQPRRRPAGWPRSCGRSLLFGAALVLGLVCGLPSGASAQQTTGAHGASAQRGGTRGKRARGNGAARRAKAKADAVPEKPVEAAPAPKPESSAASEAKPAGNAPATPAADDASVHTEGDTQVKVMEFSGLDIEGQLKTPQMLYFLNRLRAEFGRPKLPHRSFMPELQRGTQENAQR